MWRPNGNTQEEQESDISQMRSEAQGGQGQKSPLLEGASLEMLFSTPHDHPYHPMFSGTVSIAVHRGHRGCAHPQISLEAGDPENEERVTQDVLPRVCFRCLASSCQESAGTAGSRGRRQCRLQAAGAG